MIPSDPAVKPFFFILGRPRSGTTLLRFLFDAHPDVCIPFEGKVIWDMYLPFNAIERWDEETIIELVDLLSKVDRVDKWGINFDSLKSELLLLSVKPDYQDFIRIVYRHYRSEYNKNKVLIYGDKNPTYSLFPDSLLKIIPDAKIIFILRDPRDHILSMKKAGMGNGNIIRMAVQWKKAVRDILEIKKTNPVNVFILRYEDLVSEPEKHLNAFCSFLGINYSSEMLNFYLKKDSYTELFKAEGVDEKFHSKLFNPVTAAHIFRWKKEMNPHELSVIDLCVGDIALQSGYEISSQKLNFISSLKYRIKLYLTEIKVKRHHQRKNEIISN